MSMSVGGGGEGEAMCDINTTPLIDVMLVLLIMLIITIPIMTHAVKLDMPQANNPPPPDQRARSDRPGGGLRRHRRLERNGGPEHSDPGELLPSESRKEPQPEIHLRPDRRAKYGYGGWGACGGPAQPHEEDRVREHLGVPGMSDGKQHARQHDRDGAGLALALAPCWWRSAPAPSPGR